MDASKALYAFLCVILLADWSTVYARPCDHDECGKSTGVGKDNTVDKYETLQEDESDDTDDYSYEDDTWDYIDVGIFVPEIPKPVTKQIERDTPKPATQTTATEPEDEWDDYTYDDYSIEFGTPKISYVEHTTISELRKPVGKHVEISTSKPIYEDIKRDTPKSVIQNVETSTTKPGNRKVEIRTLKPVRVRGTLKPDIEPKPTISTVEAVTKWPKHITFGVGHEIPADKGFGKLVRRVRRKNYGVTTKNPTTN